MAGGNDVIPISCIRYSLPNFDFMYLESLQWKIYIACFIFLLDWFFRFLLMFGKFLQSSSKSFHRINRNWTLGSLRWCVIIQAIWFFSYRKLSSTPFFLYSYEILEFYTLLTCFTIIRLNTIKEAILVVRRIYIKNNKL